MVGAAVMIIRDFEVAFTKAVELYICAKDESCLLKKPLVVDAVSWDCRSPRLYCDATDTM
jgi:hypothetical protein